MTTRITFTCGCGFPLPTLEDAVSHSEATGHTITIHGQITPNDKADSKYVSRGREEISRVALNSAMWSYAEQNPERFPGVDLPMLKRRSG